MTTVYAALAGALALSSQGSLDCFSWNVSRQHSFPHEHRPQHVRLVYMAFQKTHAGEFARISESATECVAAQHQ